MSLEKNTDRNRFKVPENYFDWQENKLNSIANNSFKVPQSFFENQEDKLLQISASNPKIRKIIPLRWQKYVAAASIVLLVSTFGFISYENYQNENKARESLYDLFIEDDGNNLSKTSISPNNYDSEEVLYDLMF